MRRTSIAVLVWVVASAASAQSEPSWVGEHPLDPSERPHVSATWHGSNVSIVAAVPFACGAQASATSRVHDTRIVIDVAPVATGGPQCMHELRVTVPGPALPFGARIALVARIAGRTIARGRVEHTPEHVMPPPRH